LLLGDMPLPPPPFAAAGSLTVSLSRPSKLSEELQQQQRQECLSRSKPGAVRTGLSAKAGLVLNSQAYKQG
jgi:hypothetical protein